MADGPALSSPPTRRSWSWRSRAFRGLIYQIVAVSVIALVAWFLTLKHADQSARAGHSKWL